VLSIAFDPPDQLRQAAVEYGITSIPLLTDAQGEVSQAYGVLRWAVASGEPGHTFALVDPQGEIRWLQDYGAAESGGRMYVPVEELLAEIIAALE
jgi:peroxiredoxin